MQGLRHQLQALRRVATVVPLGDALDALAAGRALPPRAVALTFDDGYRDNLDLAVPLLEELGLPATFFLVPEVLDRSIVPWWERIARAFTRTTRASLSWDGRIWPIGHGEGAPWDPVAARLKELRQDERLSAVAEIVEQLDPEQESELSDLFLDWDGARALARHAAVGAHSYDHAILANESAEAQRHNLQLARDVLEDELERSIELLAYPNGTAADFDGATIDAARAAGYQHAITTIPGWNASETGAFELRRQLLFPETGLAGFKPLARLALVELRARAARS
jgi:peptidoglycan/xylan/chitin deacetylase (PgdA/CDA1 family)